MTLSGEGKPVATIRPVSRRKALKITVGSAAAAVAGLAAPGVIAAAALGPVLRNRDGGGGGKHDHDTKAANRATQINHDVSR